MPTPSAPTMAAITTIDSDHMMVWFSQTMICGSAQGNSTFHSFWRGVAPVSYTHLDVYKRQGTGRLHLKTSRSGGAFIGCGNYPECRYTRPISGEEGGSVDGRVLGVDADGVEISLRAGRFGPYVQKGEATTEAPKPPRASLPKGWEQGSLTLERAIELLSLPRQIGPHPEDGVMIESAIGRFGPYVKHGAVYANIPDVEEVFTIGMNRAVERCV